VAIDNKVEVKITADASGLARGVAVAQGSLAKLQSQLVAIEATSAKAFSFAGLAGFGLSLTAAAASMVALVKATADYGDQLDAMSQRTGVAVEELSKLQYAAKLSDTSSEALGKGIGNLSKVMVAAANGAQESGKLFERFEIPLRNADGTVRKTTEVLYDLADVFAAMPEGAEKTNLAMDLFGKKLGAELIPLLNEGSAGLRAMGDEAERLGLVLSGDQAKAAAEFNDSLDKLAATSKGYAYSIGNVLIPALNKQLDEFKQAKESTDGLLVSWLKVPFGLAQYQKARDAAASIEVLDKKISALRANVAASKSDSLYGFNDGQVDKLAKLEAERAELVKLQNQKVESEDKESAAKRVSIAAQLQRELARLEQLKAIASGKVSADILKTDKERTAEQIKDAEKLRAALQSAWEASRKEALKAGEDAQKLFDKALGVRTSAADKANELRNAGLSEEEKQASALSTATDLKGQGDYYAAAAAAAKLDGRTKDFEKYLKQSETFLDRAMKFAESSGNADLVEGTGDSQARLIESQARAKQAEAAALEAQAQAQAETIKKLDTDLDALKSKAASVEVKVDITQAEGQIAALQAQLAALNDKTVTITMQTVATDINSAGLGGFAGGGRIRGPGSGTSDSILARLSNGEFVIKAAAVDHYGAGLLNRINAMQLPRFASGGMVGGSSSGGTPLVLDFGKLGRYEASTSKDTAAAIEQVFVRAALARGKR
jgi:hypothetical protein